MLEPETRKGKSKAIMLRLPEPLAKAVEREAAQRGVCNPEVVRRMIAYWVKNFYPSEPVRSRASAQS